MRVKQKLIFVGVLLCVFSVSESTTLPKQDEATDAGRQAWFQILKWPSTCEKEFSDQQKTSQVDGYNGLTFWKVANHQFVVKVDCFSAAYQVNSMYVYYDDSTTPLQSHLLTFQIMDEASKGKNVTRSVTEVAGLSEFDTSQHALKISTKFRGAGDCGSRAIYSIENGAAVLKQFKAKFACDGKMGPYKIYDLKE